VQAGYWLIGLLMGASRFCKPRTKMQDYKQFLSGHEPRFSDAEPQRVLVQLATVRGRLRETVHRDGGQLSAPRGWSGLGRRDLWGGTLRISRAPVTTRQEATGQRGSARFGNKRFLLFSNGLCFSTCRKLRLHPAEGVRGPPRGYQRCTEANPSLQRRRRGRSLGLEQNAPYHPPSPPEPP